MKKEICEIFTAQTRRALSAEEEGYLSKDTDELALIEGLKRDHRLERVYRFDIGKHSDGYSDLIEGVLAQADIANLCRENLVEYPDNHYRLLRKRLAQMHGIDPSLFVLSAGLETMIDHISRTFLGPGAVFLVPIPNFSLFAAFSLRQGSRPLSLALKPEEGFQWTAETVEELARIMASRSPKILWISNPVNPTGQDLPLEWMEELAAEGARRGTAVVVDEAYGEYTDRDEEIVSASRLLGSYPNLMVLRTFSKIHALPSLRVGYLMGSSPELVKAVSLYRPYFPFSWFSLFVAQIASVDEEHVQKARANTNRRRDRLYKQLSELKTFSYLPSATNTIMLRRARLKARDLWQRLAQRGFLTANLSVVTGLQGQEFLRMTVRSEPENDLFVEACRSIEQEIQL
jgi:histidinol-phosphate aminotransferase